MEFFFWIWLRAGIQFRRSTFIVGDFGSAELVIVIPIPIIGRQALLANIRLEVVDNFLHHGQSGTKVGIYAFRPVSWFGIQTRERGENG